MVHSYRFLRTGGLAIQPQASHISISFHHIDHIPFPFSPFPFHIQLNPNIIAALTTMHNSNQVNAGIGLPLKYDSLPSTDILKGQPMTERDPINIMRKPLSVREDSSLDMSPSRPSMASLIPKAGVITATLLYFSPIAAVYAASKSESMGELNPAPLAIMAVSSLCWLMYGLSVRDPYVTLSNTPGCIASIWYIITLLPLIRDGDQLKQTQRLIVALVGITIHLWVYLSLSQKTIEQIRKGLGLFASALFIVLSGSPLSTIKTVISTRNSISILAPLTFAQIVNTTLWSVYGLAIGDKFVYGPNMTGLGLGLVQLILKLCFPSK